MVDRHSIENTVIKESIKRIRREVKSGIESGKYVIEFYVPVCDDCRRKITQRAINVLINDKIAEMVEVN